MEPVVDHLRAVQIGVDIGQKHDPTAIVVCQVLERPSGRTQRIEPRQTPRGYEPGATVPVMETYYEARAMERLPLGTDYPSVAARVADMVCADVLLPYSRRVLIDETGVGRPVFELIRNAIDAKEKYQRQGVSLKPITFTHGDKYDRVSGRLGKAFMVSRLQALLQTTRIKLPASHAEAQAMMRELQDYEIRVDEDANDRYGAFKVGSHDDLATALGLAVLEDPHHYMVQLGPSLY